MTVPQTATPVLRQRMTLAEFNALPEDPERERMLLSGELWEWPTTERNRRHARVEARVSQHLSNWRNRFALGQFDVFSGEVGCDLPDSESGFGIDVAIFSSETLQEAGSGKPLHRRSPGPRGRNPLALRHRGVTRISNSE